MTAVQQQKERARGQVKTTYNPDYDPERPSYGKINEIDNIETAIDKGEKIYQNSNN